MLWTTTVRPVRRGDAVAIADIYAEAILARTSTFETEPHTAGQIEAALAERGERYPTVIVERGHRIVGWAAASQHSTRTCFAGIADYAVYVERAARGMGAGHAALEALIRECECRGLWKLLGRIFPENEASRSLARSHGFREVGVLRRHAQVDGRWRDALIVEKLLGTGDGCVQTEYAAPERQTLKRQRLRGIPCPRKDLPIRRAAQQGGPAALGAGGRCLPKGAAPAA
jgi:phosphinothricin acetyltransferase